jgi:glycosyltransferase involved in cell wall biosynthesis
MYGDTVPFVTVVMPIRNEAAFIERSLGGVLAQDYPHKRMEVLIADGMSTDGTRDVIARLTENQDIEVKVVENPQRIVPTGMNIAIRQSRGDIIIRVDGHTVIEPDYVHQCITTLERSGAENVGGQMRPVGLNYLSRGIALATSTPFGIGNSKFHYSTQEQFVDTVYMGAYRKDVLIRVGLYDETFLRHQDYELNYRIIKNGGRILLSPNIRSHYYVRNSLGKLWKQYFQYGFWKAKLLRRNPDSLKWRHVIPPLFALSLFLGVLASFMVPQGKLLLWLAIALYCVFLIIAVLTTTIRLKYAPILPIIFTCLHLSYGVGIWLGLLSPRIPLSKAKHRRAVQQKQR